MGWDDDEKSKKGVSISQKKILEKILFIHKAKNKLN